MPKLIVDQQGRILSNGSGMVMGFDNIPPIVVLSNLPANPTGVNSADITVGGEDVVTYKYKLDNGSYSAETPVSVHIQLSGLGGGSHTLYVIGKDSAGNWNPEISATTYTWSVSTFSATGGTITYTDANGINPRTSPSYPDGYTIHTFTSGGTFVVNGAKTIEYLIVAGGGGGSHGGGGGGGLVIDNSFPVSTGEYTIVIGNGGAGAAPDVAVGSKGGNSSFGATIAYGGGGGGKIGTNGATSGGSGGGAGGTYDTLSYGATGTTGQGYKGGDSIKIANNQSSGGGGGATTVGGNRTSATVSGNGGSGYTSSITGSLASYAGGGGGGHWTTGTYGTASNGGGRGGNQNLSPVTGTVNTGGGGGGGGSGRAGAAGGSGIVIIRYLTQ